MANVVTNPGALRLWAYVDESIHQSLGFIATAFVFSNSDLTETVAETLAAVGLTPGTDEFKSGRHMANRPELRRAREDLLNKAASITKIAILISPASRRQNGKLIVSTLRNIVRVNKMEATQIDVFFDQGLVRSDDFGELEQDGPCKCEFHIEQDSRTILGLQVADVIAPSVAQILREELTDFSKMLPLSADDGYIDGDEAPLGWNLRMTLRPSFFVAPLIVEKGQDPTDVLHADLFGWGAFLSDDLDEGVRGAAHQVFDKLWLGCAH